ncbi:MAG: ribbon-helix-helix protein, CopG family [Chloroflexi bacterium]|nr:ribbon-helix-helix protein, CopG family [Chloroflexota bacterium]
MVHGRTPASCAEQSLPQGLFITRQSGCTRQSARTDGSIRISAPRHPRLTGRRYDIGYTTRVKTAISLPDDLFDAAQRAAQRLGLTRSELFRRALTTFLERHDDRLVTEALNRVYGNEDAGAGLHRDVQRMQALSIPPDDW